MYVTIKAMLIAKFTVVSAFITLSERFGASNWTFHVTFLEQERSTSKSCGRQKIIKPSVEINKIERK